MRFAVPTDQLIVWLLAVPVIVAIVLSSVALARRRRAREAFADHLSLGLDLRALGRAGREAPAVVETNCRPSRRPTLSVMVLFSR